MTPERLAQIRRRWGPDAVREVFPSLTTARQDYYDVQDLLEEVERLQRPREHVCCACCLPPYHCTAHEEQPQFASSVDPAPMRIRTEPPHHMACGPDPHPHGPLCSPHCPTCTVREIVG